MEKIWKDITGFEGLYKISNYGEVLSLISNKILKAEILDKGYLRIGLNKDGKRTRFLVHRLVMCEFVEYKPYPDYEVNHKDFNTQNNRIDNLEWVTGIQNMRYSLENNSGMLEVMRRVGSMVGKKYGHIGIEASKKPVAKCDMCGNVIKEYGSAREAVKDGYNYKGISSVCTGNRKSYLGYTWKFI